MAIGLFKLTLPQRKVLALIFSILNLVEVTLGICITGLSIYVYVQVSPGLFTERAEVNFVFVITGMYGTHVIFHWLIGMKICNKCLVQAHKKSTRSLLLLWTCAGTNTIVNLIIIAGMSRKINKHITKSLRHSLQYGMRRYLFDQPLKMYIDKVQYMHQCCGINAYDDWHEISWLTKYHIDENATIVEELRNDPEYLHLPVTPWSCCKVNFPMQCLHDPLQQTEYTHVWVDEPSIVTDSINTNGCLDQLRKPIAGAIFGFIFLSCAVVIIHIAIVIISRILYTACRNAILLGTPEGLAPGWIFGRGDCGYNRGPTLAEIMGIYATEIIEESDEKPVSSTDKSLIYRSDDTGETSAEETQGNVDEQFLSGEY